MAGTTVDENNVVYKTLRESINNAGYDFTLEFVLRHGAGKEKKQAIIDILKQKDVEDTAMVDSIFGSFKTLLKSAYEKLRVNTYNGTVESFNTLHNNGIKVALNTGYDSKTANMLLDKLQWQAGKEYDILVTASDVKNGRPEADMIHLIMQKLDVIETASVAKIGDSIIDIQEGQNARCGLSIGVTTGAHTKDQLESANPDHIINSLTELKNIILD